MKNAFNQTTKGRNQSETENRHKNKTPKDDKIIPDEYGEYVEFTETTSYSQETISSDTKNSKKEYREEQISDAEWEDVK